MTPRVSRTANGSDRPAHSAEKPSVIGRPGTRAAHGKLADTAKFASHSAAPATASPDPRRRSGNCRRA